jgi:hypothetical protein
MPTIPSYAIDSTEMEELNKIKRQLYTAQASSFLNISESPASDPTEGNAEAALNKINYDIVLNTDLLRNLTDSLKIDREMLTYETFSSSNMSAVKSNFKSNLAGLNKIITGLNRLIKELQDIQPNFNYTKLKTVNFFKTAMGNLSREFAGFYRIVREILNYLHNDGLLQSKGYNPSASFPGVVKKVTEDEIEKMMDRLREDEIMNGTLFEGEYIPEELDDDEFQAYEDTFRRNAIFLLDDPDTIYPDEDIPTEIDFSLQRDASRYLNRLAKINDQIKKINEPFKQILNTFYEQFVQLTDLADSLIRNFNEARSQRAITVDPELKFGMTSDIELEGSGFGRLSHPSAREMAFYRKTGLPMYM